MNIDHDALFKRLLTEFSFDFLALFFPKVAAQIVPNTLVLLDKELLGKGKRRYKKIVDLALKAKLLEEETFFIIHVEHESSPARIRSIQRRMALYALQLAETYELPVYPILITSFDRPRSPVSNRYVMRAVGHLTLQFRFHVVQLNRLNWRNFLRFENPVASALMSKMNIAPRDRVKVKLECLRMLAKLQLDHDHVDHIAQFVDVYLNLVDKEELEFMAKVAQLPELQKPTPITEIVTSWERRGRQEGLQLGKEQGFYLAQKLMVLRIAKRKFGELNAELIAQIDALPQARLESLIDALIDMTHVEQLNAYLALSKLPIEQIQRA
ncbi:MAG: DUF4351 domain-containing protein [Anaerolineae bacterium]|nr:DUF4351 domain-containing protein [Anaerolineae bacterium]